MKKILYILSLSLIFTSCVKDLGNYDYVSSEDVLPVEISGLNNDITILQGDNLILTPQISNVDDTSQYTYSWFTTESTTAGFLPTKKVWGNEKNLNAKITLDAGTYLLSFEVIDAAKDIYKRKQMNLTVQASAMGPGLYILKDKNNETDFDYINADGTMYANVLSVAGNQLKGKAVCMSYQGGRYYHNKTNGDGTITKLVNQKVFHVLSSEDIRTINAQNLQLFKTFNDEFYSAPSKCEPQSIYSGSSMGDVFLMNAGKIHSIYGMSSNIGKFGAPKVGTYSLYKQMIPLNFFGDMLVFDNLSHTFYSSSSAGSTLDEVNNYKAAEDSVISLKNMPYTMVNMFGSMSGKSSAQQAFALMKSTTSNVYRIAQIPYGKSSIFNNFNEVNASSLLLTASSMASPCLGNFVYFSIANKLYYYMNAPGLEQKEVLLTTLPSDETISYICHIYIGKLNHIAVLANNASGWKLYMFPIQTIGNPEIVVTPTQTYTGNGTARFVMYRNN